MSTELTPLLLGGQDKGQVVGGEPWFDAGRIQRCLPSFAATAN